MKLVVDAGPVIALAKGVLGFAGLLIKGREHGLVDRVVPLLLDARNHGYWLDDALIETVRRLTSE